MMQAICKRRRTSRARQLLAGALLAVGLIAPVALSGQQPPSQFRSLTDVRPRIPDEHDRPYFRETQSHRGWEIREPQFTVFAATSADDAKWAAAQVSQAWQQASSLANRWSTAHHNPDFGLSALQVVINNEPLRDRDAPATTLNVVGIQTQVQINVGPGQPALPQQIARLRQGAAFAMLHAAGLDLSAPPWAVAGIAAVAGRTGLSAEELKPNAAVDQAARFGGQQWRYRRSAEDTLDYARLDHEEAASQMTFLLKGNDAEHAPALFAELQQAGTEAAQAAADGGGFRPFPGDSQPATTTGLDQLFANLSTQFAVWKQYPQTGQPVFEPANATPELVAVEQEMLVLLKLARRFSIATTQPADAAGKATTTVIDRGPVRTKIITYNRVSGAATTDAPAKPTTLPTTFAALAARLTDPAQPVWATIDADGSLLLSTDTERLQNLLALAERRYSLETSDGHAVLVRRLDGNQTIRGWLQDNPQDKSRPLAKFEVSGGNRRGSKTIVPPRPQGQVTGIVR